MAPSTDRIKSGQRNKGGQQHHEQLFERDIRLFFRWFRRQSGVQAGPYDHVDDVKTGQHESGVSAAAYSLTTETPDTAPYTISMMLGGIRMPRQPPAQITPAANFSIVSGFQQRRKGQKSHQRDHGADDTDGGGKDRTGHQRRYRHGAGHNAGPDIQSVKQPLHDVGAFHDIAHEQKQRHSDQNIVYHYRVRLVHQQIEYII